MSDEEKDQVTASLQAVTKAIEDHKPKLSFAQQLPAWLGAGAGIIALFYFMGVYANMPDKILALESGQKSQEIEISSVRSDLWTSKQSAAADSATLHQVDERTKRIEDNIDELRTK